MKTKKKLIGIIMTLVVLAGLLFSGVAFADDPTTVDVTWDGGGAVVGSVVAGDDATATFDSWGSNTHVGEFHAVDNNNNPYTYGVDSCTFSMETAITGTGWAQLTVDRTDSKYGPAGQQSYAYVGIINGNAALQNRSVNNYASMIDANYGYQLPGGHNIVADASAYTIQRWMNSGNGDFAGLLAIGDGKADLGCMVSEASASGVRLGWGGGCYTDADFTATGTGQFELMGTGDSSATTAMAPGMTGASSFDFIANWTNGTFTVPDYHVTAN